MEGGNTKRVFIWLAICVLVIQIVPVNITGDSWTQTTQEDFEGGETWNTNVTLSPGDVTLDMNPDWWNSSWKYRIPINITENSGDDLTDFQVPIEIDTRSLVAAGKMKSDLGDIRFTDQSGELLPYWIEIEDNLGYDEPDDYIAYWNFDEGDGNTTFDLSGNEYHGTHYGNTRLLMHFDEGNGQVAKDESPYENHGQLGSTSGSESEDPTWQLSAGISNSCLQFDGIDDYIDCGNDASFDITDTITIEAWIMLNNTNNQSIVDRHGLGIGDGYGLRVINSSIVSFWINGATRDNETKTTNANLTTGVWYHLVGTYDRNLPSQNFQIYINGTKMAWKNWTKQINASSHSLEIGRDWTDSPGNYWRFNGSIDEVAVYSNALSGEEIMDHYSSRKAKFTDWTDGRYNGALEFDGKDDYVDIVNTTNLSTNVGSFEVWFNAKANQLSAARIFELTDASFTNYYAIMVDGGQNNKMRFVGRKDGVDKWEIFSLNPVDDEKWHHFVGTWDNNRAVLYIDGIEVAKSLGDKTLNLPPVPNCDIGHSPDHPYWFNGLIDEIRIYDRTLTPEEIMAIYHEKSKIWINVSSLPASQITTIYMYYGNPYVRSTSNFDATFTKDFGEEGLVGLWHMDEGTGLMANDSSGNGNHGTLVNGTSWTTEDGGQWDGREDLRFSEGSALEFDGINNHIDIQDSVTLDITDEITIEVWVYPISYKNWGRIIGKYYWTSWSLNWHSNNHFLTWEAVIGGTHAYHNFTSDLNLNQWYNIAVTFNSSLSSNQIKLYINGRLDAAYNNSGQLGTDDFPLRIGRGNDPVYFDGIIDEVRINNRSLDAGEIKAHNERRKFAYPEPTYTFGLEKMGDWRVEGEWLYRKPIIINNTDNPDKLTDFQVPVEMGFSPLITAGKMRADCRDIRFIDSNGIPIPYWIESGIDTNSTRIWIKVPIIPAIGESTILIYYGNPKASDYSFFDDTFTKEYGEKGLVGMWHMDKGSGPTVFDSSGNGNDGNLVNGTIWDTEDGGQWDNRSDVKFSTGSSLKFDGMNDYVDCGNNSNLNITQEFTLEAWVNLSESSRYNTILSKGSFALKIGPDNKAIFNARNFTTGENWTEVYDTAEMGIHSLAVFNGYLYAGTYLNGKIYRSNDGVTWTEVVDTTETYIYSLAVFDGYIYAGTDPNGTIYRSSDGTTWAEVEDTTENLIGTFAVFNGYLYAGTRPNGKIYRSSDGLMWTEVLDTSETNIVSLAVFNGYLYAGSRPSGKIYRSSDGLMWTEVLDTTAEYIFSLAVFKDYLYAGDYPNGKIYRSNDGTTWVEVEDTNEENIYALAVFNGYLYASAGTSNGKIYRSSDGTTWVEIENNTTDITSLAVFNGYLYAGSNGTIYRMGGGFDLYSNYDVPLDEWTHIAVTYNGTIVKIYLNGIIDNTMKSQITVDTNSFNLLIGNSYGTTIGCFSSTGEENYNGTIDEVRIYNRSLDAYEIKAHYERRKYTSPEPIVTIGLEEGRFYPSGTFISSVFNSGTAGTIWNSISWKQTLPPGTNITIATRSGDVIIPGPTWSNWSGELYNESGSSIPSPRSRYIQYRVTLTTADTSVTPVLHEVIVDYTLNSVTSPIPLSPPDGNWTANNTPTFTWTYSDPNLDSQVRFEVQIDDDQSFLTVDYPSGPIISSNEYWDSIIPITDGTWYWRVRTMDEYGLWSNWSENWSLNIDTTPPTQPTVVIAEPDTWTNINSFTVNWTNPSDFSGVKVGVWYKIGSPPTSNSEGTWSDTKPLTVPSYEGQQTIYLWLEDILGNVDYQNNASTDLFLDTTPPSAPINLGAIPDSWSGSNSFSINWTNPFDDSGVKVGAWCKIGSPPTSNSDGTWIDSKPFTVQSSEGQQSIYVWLEDNVGNIDYLNNASVSLYLDTTPPLPFTPTADPSGWTSNNQPVISFSTTDAGSGMSHYAVKIDSGPFVNQTSPYTLPEQTDGTRTVTIIAYDNVGNYRESSVEIYIDTTPPESFTPTADPSGWTSNNQPQITFSTTDATSGISHYEVEIDSGPFTEQTSPYTPPPQSDGTHTITVRAYDNAGNIREGTVEIYIDTTAPPAPTEIGAAPDSWTKSNSFVINWANPSEIDTSGIKTGAWYKIGSPPTSNSDGTWIGEKPFTVTSLEGEQIIYVWLEDNIGNVDYNNYGTTTLYLDTTPPDAPTDVTASPSSWSIVNSFNVDWVNPSDDSGVKTGAWYKIGSPPTSDSDGTWVGQKPITITTTDGETVIYIWLEDNLENRDYQNYGFTNLYLDSIGPNITHTPITHAKKGEAITITATVTDNVGVKTVTLHYKKQGDEAFEQVTMSKDGDVYSADIPSSFVTKQKIEYYISASDEINTATYPSSGATTDSLPIEIKDEDVIFIPSWLWFLLVLLIILGLIVLFMSRRRGEEEAGAIGEEEPQAELYGEPGLPEEESVIADGEEEAGTPLSPTLDAIPPPTQELSDDEIFENIKKKYEEGKISEETFQDFKKRYKKE